MDHLEMELILREFVKMNPDLADAPYEQQYQLCYKAYHNLPGGADRWVLTQLIDPNTYEPHWYWREKS